MRGQKIESAQTIASRSLQAKRNAASRFKKILTLLPRPIKFLGASSGAFDQGNPMFSTTAERILAADDKHVKFGHTDTPTQQRKAGTLTADEFSGATCNTYHRRANPACGILVGCTRRPRPVV